MLLSCRLFAECLSRILTSQKPFLLLIVVVQLPDGPRHDDGERYTWGEKKKKKKKKRQWQSDSSLISLRHSDHKLSLQGSLQYEILVFFFFFFSSVAPAPAKRCQEQLLLVRRDPQTRARTCHPLNLSLWMNEKPESGLTVMRSERLARWLEGAIIRQTNSHYLHLNDTKRSHEDDAASCRVTRASLTSRESFHIISDILSSAQCSKCRLTAPDYSKKM